MYTAKVGPQTDHRKKEKGHDPGTHAGADGWELRTGAAVTGR